MPPCDTHDSTINVETSKGATTTSNLNSNLPSPYFPRTPPSTPINVPTPPERTFTALMCTAKSYLDPPAIPLLRHVGERKRSCNKYNKERTFKYTTVPMLESSAKRIRNTYRRCDLTAAAKIVLEDLMPIATKAPKDSPKPAINEWGDVWRTLEGLEEDQKKIIPIRKGEKRRGEN
mmetsp:Transcript_23341/g.48575  ORF Transcript_23341/g.48575 Transcript_23341/m.48575 type:complete len:176 (+) Transcript_23341:719-1246(+)|eukprot:CAMPEP_0118637168 /NCGR_PEP_ID=MMETSP0785-20121206/3010_1 /TAXON_ID=91992 /ORGANISM="Bolidomonas pacifica, Strain CCMP 1866" /LENGTH=175 /DNA_ID=CAMNT_0006528339 /DNA_START=632 /DNA_END=1159 /DNA_ORIENTATION=+